MEPHFRGRRVRVIPRVPGEVSLCLSGDQTPVERANVVLLGALSTFLDVPKQTWLEVIMARVPEKYAELNHQAFLQGRQSVPMGSGS